MAWGTECLDHLLAGEGLDAFAAAVDALPDGVEMWLEDPIKMLVIERGRMDNKQTQAHTWAEQYHLLRRRGPVRHLPTGDEGWQRIHRGRIGGDGRDGSKRKSCAVVVEGIARGLVAPGLEGVLRRGRGVDGERADAGAMWLFVAGNRGR